MTREEILNRFKEVFPFAKIDDFRPLCHELFTDGKQGITIWLENGDVIEYYPHSDNGRMTREEAITIIDNLHLIGCGRNQHEDDLKINVALDMAIEALEDIERWRTWSHTYDNLISRQDAIDVIMGEPTDAHYPSWYADKIKSLPSVDRPIGEWIMHIDDLYPEESTQECSNCHKHETIFIQHDNYCPNCGARMKGEE